MLLKLKCYQNWYVKKSKSFLKNQILIKIKSRRSAQVTLVLFPFVYRGIVTYFPMSEAQVNLYQTVLSPSISFHMILWTTWTPLRHSALYSNVSGLLSFRSLCLRKSLSLRKFLSNYKKAFCLLTQDGIVIPHVDLVLRGTASHLERVELIWA